ncbi:MAG: hypothetical protein H7177_06360 [Rhizobacter sp.]|nr:hypothetical protein [Bacteriovorax sp.]
MNKDLYKDEFGNYHEVEDEKVDTLDGLEDDEQDITDEDEDSDDLFDSAEEDSEYDEDEEYASERRPEFDSEDE